MQRSEGALTGQTEIDNCDRLLTPRVGIEWPQAESLKSVWSGIYLIDNGASRAFWQRIQAREADVRFVIRDSVEDMIRGYSSSRYRSWILYPAKDLFYVANSFIQLIENHQDQSKSAVRLRVALMARSLLMMSDQELADHYQSYSNYAEHLAFLRAQCRYFGLRNEDILIAAF